MLRSTSLILCALVLAVNGLNYQRTENMTTTVKENESIKVAVKDGLAAVFPCPDEELFKPCTCIADADFKMDADCSAAVNDVELATAFSVEQSFCTFRSLTINPATPTDLNTFTHDTFGCVGFETIEITGTKLEVIQDGTFTNSEGSLTSLNLHSNAIVNFPFETLSKFTKLITLNLHTNFIGTVQNLESDSMVTLNLNDNPTLDISLGLGLFGRAPKLETLRLHNCGIVDLTTDMFMSLESIKTIDLSMNEIVQLRENVIDVPNPTLESLDFSDNPLYDIAVRAINKDRLVAAKCTLTFANTQFVDLCEITWGEYVNHLAPGSVNLAGNPLRCGCDMAWLFDDLMLNQKLEPSTACSDGYIVQDLIPEVFTAHCEPMPAGLCTAELEREKM